MKDNKKVNGKNKNDNYTSTYKIDADVEDFLKNIAWVYFLEKRIEMNATKYINRLIRLDMIEILGLDKNITDEELKSKWYEYKRKNNL